MSSPTDSGPDFVARARSLQPLVRAAADEAERERRLPGAVAEAMAKQGLYRVGALRSIQGAEASPETQIRVIEAISEADGSAGWNLMIGIESFGLLGATFERGPELFADPRVIVCSSTATAATGVAERVPGGYRVSGRWPFVSGCHNSFFFGGVVEVRENGAARASPLPVFAVVPREDFEILDTWNVAGLRGSGSHDVRVDGVLVPEENLTRRPTPATLASSPALRIPLGVRLAYNKVGVGFGIARAAIDAFVELAIGKLPRFSSSRLRERPSAQRAVARAEVRLRSARALVFELVAEVWDRAMQGAETTDRDRALFQIACSDASAASAEAVETVVEAAGTSANQLDSPLERRARDVRVIRQHVTVAPHLLEDGGRVLLGLEPQSIMLALLR
jgi:alkylation response protein AidB-like acyl-CoA dehydrogenase